VPSTWWPRDLVGDNQESKTEFRSIFAGSEPDFSTPKPSPPHSENLEIAAGPNATILDSFAVLEQPGTLCLT